MPKPFTRLSAIAAPIMRTNIDTDVIIRIERLLGNSVRGTLGAGPPIRSFYCNRLLWSRLAEGEPVGPCSPLCDRNELASSAHRSAISGLQAGWARGE